MKLLIQNARLAFPDIWEARRDREGKGKPKFGCNLIIPGDHPQIADIEKAMKQVAKDKWAAKADAIYKQLEAQDKLALHAGLTKAQYAGFDGNLFLSARSDTRPSIFDRDRTPLQQEDGKPYAGCYVNASLEFWAQDHKDYGKRINAQLRGLQFHSDGDSFAAGSPASEDEFEDLGNQDNEDPLA